MLKYVPSWKTVRRGLLGLLIVLVATVVAIHVWMRNYVTWLPGEPGVTSTAELDQNEGNVRDRLYQDVCHLSVQIGGRSIYNHEGLLEAEKWLESRFTEIGYQVHRQEYVVYPSDVIPAILRIRRRMNVPRYELPPYEPDEPEKTVANLWVEIEGVTHPDTILLVGAHFDSVGYDCPGADDNASGVAGLLEIARYLKNNPPYSTVILAAFTCEELLLGIKVTMGNLSNMVYPVSW